ncbi:hypothetical protein CH373_14405 [Leptospira perolatii]|uniref:Uncharacterized protein n=1 Tax=Leptospira perolatii TaxID=2023191 RepID=A0A2M9ZJX1_9LEPT|nr:hypothetical protein [Leptospira perolatii]PJZ69271.1 hypothetical protein CH360_12215 [Leptospira perolatii]PJZ72347.1 hypothetical protein CH373_14405 [Leptospira perolatii]
MITRKALVCIALLFLPALSFADTVRNNKTNEVIENVKTSETEQGVIVEYEDGTKRGFDRTIVTVEKKDVAWKQKEEEDYPAKQRYIDYGIMGGMALLFLLLP